ncbi:Uncharacterised protein [Mycobacteroides abscessus subsp. abscessus]|nr:Uncharacterised protein [Mycobacteroides abscessus subsp. abscessus]
MRLLRLGSLRRLAGFVFVVTMAASCGSPPVTARQSAQQDAEQLGIFAFTTTTQLGLVRNGDIAYAMTTSTEPRYPVFTDSGKFVAAILENGRIVATGFTQESSRTIQAHAGRVFAGRGNTITWWEAPNQLVSLDLSDRLSEPIKKPIDTPGGPAQSRLISLADGVAILAQGRPEGSPEELVAMSSDDGTFHQIGPAPDTAPIRIAFPNTDGRQFAYAASLRAACPKDAVTVLDTLTGQAISPMIPYSIDNKVTTRKLWWDTDRLLHASIVEKPCTAKDDAAATVTAWKLDQDKWIRATPDGVLVSRKLGNDAVALVSPTNPKQSMGTLWIDSGGDRKQIAENVTDLATPRETAPTGSPA